MRFWIQLFVRNGSIPSQFSFQRNRELSNLGQHLEQSDTLLNDTDVETLSMNDHVPWRAGREKGLLFMRILMQLFSKPGDTVLDWKAGVGKIYTSCSTLV